MFNIQLNLERKLSVLTEYKSFEEIEKLFKESGISVDNPGFYDHPKFLELENENPKILELYAKYVQGKPRTEEYNKKIIKLVPYICDLYYRFLARTDRTGASSDMSLTISQVLNRFGIWNYVAMGATTHVFPKERSKQKYYTYAVDIAEKNKIPGYAWVVAPPFYVVDSAISAQGFPSHLNPFLEEIVCDAAATITETSNREVFCPEVFEQMARENTISIQYPSINNRSRIPFHKEFPARELYSNEVKIKYIPMSIQAPEGSFEEAKNLDFNGKTSFDIFKTELKSHPDCIL